MRTRNATIASAIVLLLCAPMFALAEGESMSRMEAMEERLMALEDRLEASEATVAAQRELLKGANVSGGALGQAEGSRFWDRVTFGGFMASSYVYNFNDPDGDYKLGSQPFNQFNLNHNTFELDAVKLEMGLPTNGPGTAGFQFDLLYGENNHILCGDENVITIDDPDDSLGISQGGGGVAAAPFTGDESISLDESSDTNLCIQQAYMSYDWNGIVLDFGKWETLLGYEVIDSVDNHHIQQGMLFTWAIPLTHTGLRISGNFTEEISYALGLVNGWNNVQDSGDSKGLVGQIAFNSGPLLTSISSYYGSEEYRFSWNHTVGGVTNPIQATVGIDDREVFVLDFVGSYMFTDSLEGWVNVDWGQLDRKITGLPVLTGPGGASSPFLQDVGKGDPQWWGVATGLAADINENFSVAGRFEYFNDDNGSRVPLLTGPEDDLDYYTATGTITYNLTERLMARAEYRYDWYDSDDFNDKSFPTRRGTNFRNYNSVGLVEVSYKFD